MTATPSPEPSSAPAPLPLSSGPGRLDTLRREFGFELAAPALVVGCVTGTLAVIRALSVSALVFAGTLEPFAAMGTSFGLLSAVILGAVLLFAGGYPGSTSLAQIEPAVILALIAVAVVSAVGAEPVGDVAGATMVAAIAISSLLFGITLFLLGAFRLGNLIRFIPYPVVAGFLAGVGWLLVSGSFTTMTTRPLEFENIRFLVAPEILWRWLPGIGFGLALWVLNHRIRHYLVMPLAMAAGIALFYAAAAIFGATFDDLRTLGFLYELATSGVAWQFPLSFAPSVEWRVLWNELPTFGTLIVISVLAFLLIVGSIEVAVRRDIDLNRELRVTGIANLIGALGGAFPAFHSLSGTILAHRMGAPVRLTGLIGTVLCLAVFFFGSDALTFMPKPVIGGLLFFLGLDLLKEWAIETRSRLARTDYALVLIVLMVTGSLGILEGIGTGILIGIVLFVINYSRTSVVRHALSGADFRSNVDRPEPQRLHLGRHGEAIHVLRLQGFIFFGTANRLLAMVRERLDDSSRPPARFVILDLARVIGLDASAVLGFARMVQYAQDRAFHLVLTGLSPSMAAQLHRERIGGEASANIHFFPDLDHAMEWCEDRLLATETSAGGEIRDPLAEQLRRIAGGSAVDVGDFLAYVDPFEIKPGDHLIRQKERSNDLYFIETGKVSVRLEMSDGRYVRLRAMGPGTIVGEVAFYLDIPRSASVIAERLTTGYRLRRENLRRLRVERPDLAAMFHEFIAHRLSERVAETGRLVDTLIG